MKTPRRPRRRRAWSVARGFRRASWTVLYQNRGIMLQSSSYSCERALNTAARKFAAAVGLRVDLTPIGSRTPTPGSRCQGSQRKSPRAVAPGTGSYVIELIAGNPECKTFSWRILTPGGRFLLASRTYGKEANRTLDACRVMLLTGLEMREVYIDSQHPMSDQLSENDR